MVRTIYASADKKEFVHARGLKIIVSAEYILMGRHVQIKGIPEKVINSFVKNGILSWGEDNLDDYPLDESTDFDDVKRLK